MYMNNLLAKIIRYSEQYFFVNPWPENHVRLKTLIKKKIRKKAKKCNKNCANKNNFVTETRNFIMFLF